LLLLLILVLRLGTGQLFATAALLPLLLPLLGLTLHGVGRLLLRSKWLLLSIGIAYLWFTPGSPVLPALGAYSPTWSGAETGTHRLLVLLIFLLLVNAYLTSSSRNELVSALFGLLRPLSALKFRTDRFVVRTLLVLELVAHPDRGVAPAPTVSAPRKSVDRYIHGLAGAYASAVSRAAEASEDHLQLQALPSPGLFDFIALAAVLGAWAFFWVYAQ
jgi:energy-coupling factor transport system permease protein